MIRLLVTTCILCGVITAMGQDAIPGAIRIWPLGDSITGGYAQNSGYRRNLWQKLHAAGRNIDFVGTITNYIDGELTDPDYDTAHDGHRAWRTDEILAQIDSWTEQVKPDMVLLFLGTNDLIQEKPVDEAAENIARIIERIRAINPSVAILVAQISPNSMTPASIAELNTRIGEMASLSTKKSPVVIVDQHSGFEVDADTWDGVHPNGRGAEKMAVRWFDAVKRTMSAM